MPTRTRTALNVALATVIVAAVGGGAWLLWPRSAASAQDATQLTTTVQQGTVSSTISASGSVSAVREVVESFAVTGTIATVDVAVGSVVTAGQQLGTLDTTDLQAAVDAAATKLAYAKQDLAAAQAEQNAQTSQINQAKQSVTEANQALASARADLASATLTASIGGLVIAVTGAAGDATSSGGGDSGASGFVTIADVSQYVVTAEIAEADVADVTVQQAATVSFPALGDDVSAPAVVSAVSPTATESNSIVTYATTVVLTEPPANLRLGQTAEIAITTASSAEDALYVPAAAITTAADGTSTVDLVDPDTGETTTVTVETGIVGDDGTEITSGLSAGDTVVLGTVAADTGDDTSTDDGGGQFMQGGPAGGGFPADGTGGPQLQQGGN